MACFKFQYKYSSYTFSTYSCKFLAFLVSSIQQFPEGSLQIYSLQLVAEYIFLFGIV